MNNLAESNLFLLVAFFPLPLLLTPIISLPIKDVTDAKSKFQGVYQKIYSGSTSGTRLMIHIVTKNSTKKLTDLKGFLNRQSNRLITLTILQGNATAVGICQINFNQYRRKNKMISD